ncbi:MAG: hypothetical protein ACQJCO_01125 [cyanobacterium endosymbiont of Rhopalodia sterrenbergii]
MTKTHINKVWQENSKHLMVIQSKKSLEQLMSNDINKSSEKSIEGELFDSLFGNKK